VFADLRDIDAIVTDPPYELEYVHFLHDLAALADRIFKPDGIMAVLDGQT
jgi:tRNA G10  N-methylase Trm11